MTTRYQVALKNNTGTLRTFGFSARKTKSVLFKILDENVYEIVNTLRLDEPEKAQIKWDKKRKSIAIMPADGIPPVAEFGFGETEHTIKTQNKIK